MSTLHPILARKGRFAPLLSTAIPLAALLTGLLARPGAFTFGEAVSLAWPLAFVALLSLIHITEPTRHAQISYAVFCF
jgi:hypothetical protein